jgi:Phage Mu protein F like protein
MAPKPAYLTSSSPGVKIIQTSGMKYVPPSTFYKPPPDTILGINTTGSWWTAGQPILPVAPAETGPVGMQFLSEQNKIFTPRATEFLTFDDLRRLATYPVAAIMISEHSNSVAARQFRIRLRQLPGMNNKQREEAEKKDAKILQLTQFLMNPSPDTTWREFCYMWTHEVQTTDAPAIFVRRNARRDIAELRVIDGTMIARYIDDNGWTPSNESPAYAQLWWGTPAWNLKRDQLFYRPKHPRVYKIYGNSPTERSARFLELGYARLELKLQWAENGTIPDGLMVVPPNAPVELIERQQAWMNSMMTGNAQRRVQLRLIQGFAEDGKDNILFPKEKMLMDPYDEYEIRMLAVNYGVPKQRYMAQMNRASAESAQEAAEEEGYWPTQQYIMDSMNILIQSPLYFNLPGYEFTWQDIREKDVLKQAQADDMDIRNGVKGWTEVRDDRGLDARDNPMDAGPVAFGAPVYNAYDSAKEVQAGKQPQLTEGEPKTGPHGEVLPPEPKLTQAPKKGSRLSGRLILDETEIEDMNKSNIFQFIHSAKSQPVSQLDKAHHGMTIDPHHLTLQGETARSKTEGVIRKHLTKVARELVAKINSKKMRKADEDDIRKLLDDDEFWTSLWIALPPDLTPELESAVRAGMSKGLLETNVSISNSDAINKFNAIAQKYASERAAEMVGMKYDDAGDLVANPKAQYVISETTRKDLRNVIAQAFEDETPLSELVDEIKNAGTFSVVRAQMIANTEVSRAQAGGTYSVWEQTGVVQAVRWQNSNLPGVCADCIENAEAGEVPFGKPFPSGELYPPAHPNCRCVVYAAKVKSAA